MWAILSPRLIQICLEVHLYPPGPERVPPVGQGGNRCRLRPMTDPSRMLYVIYCMYKHTRRPIYSNLYAELVRSSWARQTNVIEFAPHETSHSPGLNYRQLSPGTWRKGIDLGILVTGRATPQILSSPGDQDVAGILAISVESGSQR
jgi:hypothetical protein